MIDRVNLILKNKDFIENYNQIVEFEKDRLFCKHDMEHLLNVARIMVIKDSESSKVALNKDIIYATAILHDIGRSIEYKSGVNHNVSGGILAKEILRESNFDDKEILLITSVIINHNEDEITSYLSSLLHYADKQSRNCFICNSRELCKWSEEKKNKGIEI